VAERWANALPAAPEESFFALGTGGNICWIDPGTDIAAVLRWIDMEQADAFIATVMSAITGPTTTARRAWLGPCADTAMMRGHAR
jgi:hypothetical protein